MRWWIRRDEQLDGRKAILAGQGRVSAQPGSEACRAPCPGVQGAPRPMRVRCAARRWRYWDVTAGEQVARLDGHGDYVRASACSPAQPDLWATGAYDHTCRLWDVRAGGVGALPPSAHHPRNPIPEPRCHSWRPVGHERAGEVAAPPAPFAQRISNPSTEPHEHP